MWKPSIRVKIVYFYVCDLEIWQMTSKTIGQLFHAYSSCVHHFINISAFDRELQPENTQFWSKSMIFFSRVTLKFGQWPWKTKGHLSHSTSSFVHHFIIICQFKLKLTVRKRVNWVLTSVTLTFAFDLWPWPFAWTSLLSLVINSENFMII